MAYLFCERSTIVVIHATFIPVAFQPFLESARRELSSNIYRIVILRMICKVCGKRSRLRIEIDLND